MINYWQMLRNGLTPLNAYEKGNIVNVVNPTPNELGILQTTFKIPEDFLNDVMDLDERSRLEFDEGKMLVIYRIPVHNSEQGLPYTTIPVGIVMDNDNLVIICSQRNDVLDDFFTRSRKNTVTEGFLDLILQLFIRTTIFYHRYLKQINYQTNQIEADLEKSTKNKELHKLLRMEKCLVYFTTSLRSNELLIAKMRGSKFIEFSENAVDLLDEAIIETKQAIEMSNIYSDIQSGMMDAFASVISNNLNNVMKQLALITIILMIPTLVASFYGMNVPNQLETNPYAFAGIIAASVALAMIGVVIFWRRRWM